MSRSACTNRSSIVLMSFEKKPMTFILSWCSRDQLRCNRAFDRQRATRPGVPRDLLSPTPSAMLPTLELGTKRFGPNPPSRSARESARALIIRLRAIEIELDDAGAEIG